MLALLALLPLLALSSASPVQKRYTGAKIQSYRDGTCLGLASSTYANGVQVVKVDCAKAPGWDINPGSGSVILSGTNFALDAGTGADNNEIVKIWQSYPTLFQQTWFLTGDKRIAITGGNQCLDEGDNGPQTYQCTTGNTNQIWNVLTGGSSPSSSSSSSAPSSTSSSTPTPTGVSPGIPSGVVYTDPANGGHRIHPYGRDDLCVTVGNGYAAQGTAANIAYCFSNDDEFVGLQLWNATSTSYGAISLVQHPQYCLDGGSNPSDGSSISINTCGNGDQQVWDFGNGKLQLAHSQYCLDVQLGSGITNQNPYSIEENLQVWQCFDGNTQQQFHEL